MTTEIALNIVLIVILTISIVFDIIRIVKGYTLEKEFKKLKAQFDSLASGNTLPDSNTPTESDGKIKVSLENQEQAKIIISEALATNKDVVILTKD